MMTPLEAARRLAQGNVLDNCPSYLQECPFCGMGADRDAYSPFKHSPDCAWLQMPKIVKALEAAQELEQENMRLTEERDAAQREADTGTL